VTTSLLVGFNDEWSSLPSMVGNTMALLWALTGGCASFFMQGFGMIGCDIMSVSGMNLQFWECRPLPIMPVLVQILTWFILASLFWGFWRRVHAASLRRAWAPLCEARKALGFLRLMFALMTLVVGAFLAMRVGSSFCGCIATWWGHLDVTTSLLVGFNDEWSSLPSMVGNTMALLWALTGGCASFSMQGFGMIGCDIMSFSGMNLQFWECRLLPIMPVLVPILILAIFASLFCGFWRREHHDGFGAVGMRQLHGAFRGGAGGSDVTDN
ncbi:MAG: hypothetical protein OIF58_01960, partial [Cohaesibacter sp.]|nr:hypothetical protein [Cohaesibacter sp.]